MSELNPWEDALAWAIADVTFRGRTLAKQTALQSGDNRLVTDRPVTIEEHTRKYRRDGTLKSETMKRIRTE